MCTIYIQINFLCMYYLEKKKSKRLNSNRRNNNYNKNRTISKDEYRIISDMTRANKTEDIQQQ